jgi:deazaflavin-dependent oxidoreductase (nitroreductase family)
LSAADSWVDESFCYITTVGRRTGRPHTIEIWFGVADGRLYVLSGGARSDWFLNLKAHPDVLIRAGRDDDRRARATVVDDSEEDTMARRLLAAKYQGWSEGKPLSSWARTAHPVRFELSPA